MGILQHYNEANKTAEHWLQSSAKQLCVKCYRVACRVVQIIVNTFQLDWPIFFYLYVTVYWESLVGEKFGEFGNSSVIELKPSKLVLTINNVLADLIIRQIFFHQMLKKS